MNDTSTLFKMFLMNTLGEAILVETLRSAAYFFTHSRNGIHDFKHYRDKNNLHESRHCYFFVQGTGLDLLIHKYQLDYDPDNLRDRFNYILCHAT